MVGSEGATVGPLGVAGAAGSVADGDPAVATDADPVSGECFFEPGDDEFCLGFMRAFGQVVVGEGAVERVLSGDEAGWEIAAPFGGVGVVVTAEGDHPVGIPGRGAVVDGVIDGGTFANPEDGGHDTAMPRVLGGGAKV